MIRRPLTIEELKAAKACEPGLELAEKWLPNLPEDWQARLAVEFPDFERWLITNGFADPLTGGAIAGYRGTATAGYRGTATAGEGGTATAGEGGTATAGNWGTATAGNWGTATAGEGGTATAGEFGIIQIRYFSNGRWRIKTGYIGEDGLKPNTPYRLDENNEFAEVAK